MRIAYSPSLDSSYFRRHFFRQHNLFTSFFVHTVLLVKTATSQPTPALIIHKDTFQLKQDLLVGIDDPLPTQVFLLCIYAFQPTGPQGFQSKKIFLKNSLLLQSYIFLFIQTLLWTSFCMHKRPLFTYFRSLNVLAFVKIQVLY